MLVTHAPLKPFLGLWRRLLPLSVAKHIMKREPAIALAPMIVQIIKNRQAPKGCKEKQLGLESRQQARESGVTTRAMTYSQQSHLIKHLSARDASLTLTVHLC
jgi:hypothetical protein